MTPDEFTDGDLAIAEALYPKDHPIWTCSPMPGAPENRQRLRVPHHSDECSGGGAPGDHLDREERV